MSQKFSSLYYETNKYLDKTIFKLTPELLSPFFKLFFTEWCLICWSSFDTFTNCLSSDDFLYSMILQVLNSERCFLSSALSITTSSLRLRWSWTSWSTSISISSRTFRLSCNSSWSPIVKFSLITSFFTCGGQTTTHVLFRRKINKN